MSRERRQNRGGVLPSTRREDPRERSIEHIDEMISPMQREITEKEDERRFTFSRGPV